MKKVKIGFIGAGNMAQAMIKALRATNAFAVSAYDVDAKKVKAVAAMFGAKKASSAARIASENELIVIAVKPGQVQEVLEGIKGVIRKGSVIVSIAAGVTIDKIRKAAGAVPVVRVMPNTPALVAEGACAYALSKGVGARAEKLVLAVLNSFCKVCFRMPEKQINTVTALSGSGPAYFFYIAEAMISAAKFLRFPPDKAKKLTAQAMIGAGRMLLLTGDDPAVLRGRVTSKKGTTHSAIKYMDRKRVKMAVAGAVMAAKRRADELGK